MWTVSTSILCKAAAKAEVHVLMKLLTAVESNDNFQSTQHLLQNVTR